MGTYLFHNNIFGFSLSYFTRYCVSDSMQYFKVRYAGHAVTNKDNLLDKSAEILSF